MNIRLQHAFSICKDLGIDDPIHWLNNTKPIVLDWWIAYYSLKADQEAEMMKSTSGNVEMSPEEAGEYLSRITS